VDEPSPPFGGGVPKGRGGDLRITTPNPSLIKEGREQNISTPSPTKVGATPQEGNQKIAYFIIRFILTILVEIIKVKN